MAPKDLLGFLLLVAAFSPGYIYVRIAERRHVRPPRSSLIEGVELVSIGALASSVAALIVIAVGDWTHGLDTTRLFRNAGDYAGMEPVRCLVAVIVVALIAYGLAAGAAAVFNSRTTPSTGERVVPGGTVWQQLLRTGKAEDRRVVLNVELRDGRILTGIAHAWTAHDAEHREIAIRRPASGGTMLMREKVGAPLTPIADDFIVLREDDILGLYGRLAARGGGPLTHTAPARTTDEPAASKGP